MDATYYEIKTDDGPILAADYTHRGIDYVQKEIGVETLLTLTEILTDIGLAGVLDLADAPTIKLGEVIAQIAKHKAHDKILRTLLSRKDGQPIPENTFSAGRAIQLWTLAEKVLTDFFTINGELSSRITDSALRMFANGLQLVAEHLPQLTSYISSATATSPSSPAPKRKRSRK